MKAWLIRPKDYCGAEIIFAETRGKARYMAMSTDCCDSFQFTDIEVHRASYADKYYKEGKWHLDWGNPKDRVVLVKDCGFVCDYEYLEWEDCENCPAKEYCDRYQDHLGESEDTE